MEGVSGATSEGARILKFLRYLAVCTASFWAGLVLALTFHEFVWSLMLVCSGVSVLYFLLMLILKAFRLARSPKMKPKSHYDAIHQEAPTRRQHNQLTKRHTTDITALTDRLILDLTNEAIANSQCQCCGKQHFMLSSYPFDPQFHETDCVVPRLRSLIVPVSIYCAEVRRKI
jgi:hypothetical protein